MTIPMYGMGGQVASLLRQAKKASGLLDEDETEGAPPSAMPQMMGTPAFNPNAQDPRATSPQGDPTHAHRSGLLGRVGHAFGGDRIQPEVAALLSPDQQKRVRRGAGGALLDYLVRGETTGEAQTRRASEMLALGDTKSARDKAARDERLESQIQAAASQMDPQAGAEYAARMRLMYGLQGAAPLAQATDNMRDPVRLPVQETFSAPRPMRIGGKEVMVQMGSLGTQRIVPDAEPIPTTPAQDNTIVAIDDGMGNPVYVPRAEAIGKKPWQAPVRPPVATARVQETYRKKSAVLDDLNKAIDVYRGQLDATGIELMPGAARSRLTGSYANLKLLAKEAANLGALTGPDVKILEELFNDPASFASAGMNILERGKRKQSLLEQLDQYRSIINGNRATLEENYRREMEMSGGDSAVPAGAAGLRKTALPKPANATPAEWAAFLLTRGEMP